MTKKSFPKIERNKNLLEHIHYNIFELNGLLIKEDNDTLSLLFYGHSRYAYVYLMRTKDEAFDIYK